MLIETLNVLKNQNIWILLTSGKQFTLRFLRITGYDKTIFTKWQKNFPQNNKKICKKICKKIW